MENGYTESFNGSFRDECLNEHWFRHLCHAKELIAEWQDDYNQARPHSSLNYLTPNEFAQQIGGKKPNITLPQDAVCARLFLLFQYPDDLFFAKSLLHNRLFLFLKL